MKQLGLASSWAWPLATGLGAEDQGSRGLTWAIETGPMCKANRRTADLDMARSLSHPVHPYPGQIKQGLPMQASVVQPHAPLPKSRSTQCPQGSLENPNSPAVGNGGTQPHSDGGTVFHPPSLAQAPSLSCLLVRLSEGNQAKASGLWGSRGHSSRQ